MAYNNDQFNDELMHYDGVLGMRWGHRKAQPRSGGTRAQRTEISKRLYDEAKAEYKKSEMGRMESEWRKKNPRAAADDFGDYLTTKPKYSERKDTHYQKSQKLAADAHSLSKNYVKEQVFGSAAMSALTIAPVAGLVAKKATKSGKAGALAALGVVGGVSVAVLVKNDMVPKVGPPKLRLTPRRSPLAKKTPFLQRKLARRPKTLPKK